MYVRAAIGFYSVLWEGDGCSCETKTGDFSEPNVTREKI